MPLPAVVRNVQGGKVITGGKRPSTGLGGYFFEPTLVGDITTSMDFMREEVFGPVAPIVKFTQEADVIRMANSVNVGLAGYFYSRDLARVWRVAEALEVGMVAVNEGILSSEVLLCHWLPLAFCRGLTGVSWGSGRAVWWRENEWNWT